MPEGVMPIQRLGLKQGEGAAQVFSFPEISRDLEYMRQRKAQDRQNQMLQERQQAMNRRKMLDDQLNKLDDSPMWHTNEMYFKEVTGLVDEARNTIFDNIERVAAGDTQAIRDVTSKVSYATNRAKQIEAYKNQATKALALAQQDPKKWSDKKVEQLVELNQGKIAYDDLVEKDPNWDWYDVEDIQPYFKEMEDNYAGLITQTVNQARSQSIAPGVMEVQFDLDIGEAIQAAKDNLESDPRKLRDIASYYGVSPDEGEKIFLADLINRMIDQKESVLRSYTVQKPTGDRVTPEQIQEAAEVKQAVRDYSSVGDVGKMNRYIQGFGWNVQEYDNGDLEFYQLTENQDGDETKRNVHTIKKSNEQGFYNMIAKINPNITMEMIQAAPEPSDPDVRWDADARKNQGYDLGGVIYTEEELRQAGWSDEQIKKLNQ